ncbi:hypothetical protein F2P45_23495 [Massilia sp. CCM 8733]|uniref:Secreted protein n=1 Tax=Massilia mucilaginosa TaxID=2609282 RepID=A0ABX0P086_9BURK|nr:hypothetical protein [Massilia mucilaginosa]NHZ91947.1 hypothetical protein [Massilia mucilaginosa]
MRILHAAAVQSSPACAAGSQHTLPGIADDTVPTCEAPIPKVIPGAPPIIPRCKLKKANGGCLPFPERRRRKKTPRTGPLARFFFNQASRIISVA